MSDLIVKKSNINGSGLFTKRTFKAGEKIAHISGEIHVFRKFTPEISERMMDWIGTGRFSWINTDDSIFRFINHSCEPTAYISGRRTVTALTDIDPETEITMDYSLTEAEPGWFISCHCGAKNCRGKIGPISSLSKSEFKKKKKYIPKNFQKIYEVNLKKLST